MSLENGLLQENIIKVGKYNINYLKVGHGDHVVFCLPGSMGTIWTDFKNQIEGFDMTKFCLIVWDPPGYGKSRPPEREFTVDHYTQDVEVAYEFMKKLNISKFSLVGWCNGGATGIHLAARYPQSVHKLVVWGTRSHLLQSDIGFFKKIRDVSKWSKKMSQPMIDYYGFETFKYFWENIVDTLENVYKTKGTVILSTEVLNSLRCSTLILHGTKDLVVEESSSTYVHQNIQGSRLYVYPEGKHNVHLKFAEDFNRRVQEFLLED